MFSRIIKINNSFCNIKRTNHKSIEKSTYMYPYIQNATTRSLKANTNATACLLKANTSK